LDVHALGHGLDDEVAFGQRLEIVGEVARPDELGQVLAGQRRGLELAQALNALLGQLAARPVVAGQVVEVDRNAGGGQMRGNLRTHHPGTQYRGASYLKLLIGHWWSSLNI